jgi:hypothetical protein
VLVEVLLEIEVRELFRLRHLEELAKRSIRLDVVLVLQVLFLDIGVELLGHIGAGDEGASRVTEETAELIRNLGGDFEDGKATLDRLAVLRNSSYTALATTSILDFTVDTLIKALDFSNHGGHSLAERREGGEDGLEVIIKSGDRSSGGFRGGYRSSHRSGGRSRYSRSRSRSGLATSFLGFRGRRSNGGYRSGGRSGDRNSNNFISLLGNTLGLSGGGSNRGVHYTSTGGRIHIK